MFTSTYLILKQLEEKYKNRDMEIKVINDGKGKAQSFEASLTIESESSYWNSFTVNFDGYGCNKYSAEQNLIFSAVELREKLDELIKKYS